MPRVKKVVNNNIAEDKPIKSVQKTIDLQKLHAFLAHFP